MDKNTIIGILLIGIIFIGYSYYNTSKMDKAYKKEISLADSLYTVKDYDKAILAYRKAASFKPRETYAKKQIDEINRMMGIKQTVQPETTADTVLQEASPQKSLPVQKQDSAKVTSQYGIFSSAVNGQQDFVTIENNVVRLKISNKGGRIYSAELKNFHTYDTMPLILFDGDSTIFGFQFFTGDNHPIRTNELYFMPLSDQKHIIVEDQPVSLKMRLEIGKDKYIEYVYTLKPDEYMIDFDMNLKGMKDILAQNLSALDLSWEMYMPQQERGRKNEDYYVGYKYKYYQDEVDGSRDRSSKAVEEDDIITKIRWMAFKDQFFSSALIMDDPALNAWVQYEKMPEDSRYLRQFKAKMSLPYSGDENSSYKMHFYFGPNNYKLLKSYNLGLENLVSLGRNIIRWINEYVIINLFNWLGRYISNYGLIILVLTLIIKMVLFPLTFKSYTSQAKMKVLKPQVDQINAEFPKKEDAMKKQQATMALYKRVGVSPMGGCLPMILQMPILFAMFRFFPTSIELRQQSFLWATDLSTYDSILRLPFTIPMYGDHVSLFTLLMTISTILTMKINSPSQSSGQIPGMKGMMYIMPVMFMVILNNYSAGLTYYYFLANLITFGQNMIAKRFIDDEEILKKLEASKKKPVKKSKWQQRLEVAAKSKGYKSPKR